MTHLKAAARLVPLAVLLAIACKKNEAPPADTTAAIDSSAATAPLRVTGVETGKGLNADKTIKDDAHDFGVRDTIYASVKTEGSGTGKLSATWLYQDGKTVNETSQDIAPTGDAYNEFHITKASAWPKGDYKVVIRLNGDSVGAKDFSVK